ncbi:hypothetical protein IQ247_12310 [Plectonema cf. radiosum LEGE 06105]|uniref:Uncharacterized protein n=1 Tax=Plectonema cf. radiosum LEGE 06105 TaxID=945769 RepID=A0A8J7F4N0_9CYAN|nr:hypothetical protein [Plectonema radiosum]MBE9213440.1 hypothetical protein [Plectonema cf. radiosum LEGE 06105]
MFKNVKAQPYFLGLGIAAALLGAVAAPVSAQSVIIINGGNRYYERNQHPTVGNFIYGSPIPTPVPVNPATGHIPTQRYFSQPHIKRKIYNSTFINPILVNPRIIKNYPRRNKPSLSIRDRNYRQRRYHQPASRIIIYSK